MSRIDHADLAASCLDVADSLLDVASRFVRLDPARAERVCLRADAWRRKAGDHLDRAERRP